MSLTIEDGSGLLPDADSYITAAEADTYHARRANVAWAALTLEAKEAALLRAQDYMTQAYRGRWKGWRTQTTQALDWPRTAVQLHDMAIAYQLEHNVIPPEVRRAQAELALKAATLDTLAPDQSRAVISESVGAVAVTYDRFSPQQVKYHAIDMILAPLLGGSPNSVSVVRA